MSEENMWRHKQQKVLLQKLNEETESIRQILMRVSKSNWCLICCMKLPDETTIRAHFLNVHQKGTFPCPMLGCLCVASTNGELRMHCLVFHPAEMWSLSALPNNPLAPTNHIPVSELMTKQQRQNFAHQPIIQHQIAHQPIEPQQIDGQRVAHQPIIQQQQQQQIYHRKIDHKRTGHQKRNCEQSVKQKKSQPKVERPEVKRGRPPKKNPKPENTYCNKCGMTYNTVLGKAMHGKIHRLVSLIPKMKKMSDIESVDELKRTLEMNGEQSNALPVPMADKLIAVGTLPIQITLPSLDGDSNFITGSSNVVQESTSPTGSVDPISATPSTSGEYKNGTAAIQQNESGGSCDEVESVDIEF